MPNLQSNFPTDSQYSETEGLDVQQLLGLIWKDRKPLFRAVAAVAVVAVVVSLLLPRYYLSTASLLPETDKAKLAGLSSLASLAGVNLGETSLEQLYPTIVSSEAVLREVIFSPYQTALFDDSVTLVQYWEIDEETDIETFEVALEMLRDNLEVHFNKITQVVTISVWTTEPELSAEVVNRITIRLDEFIRTKRNTNASEQRMWIERRLDEVRAQLQSSENELKEFREKNRRVIDSPELILSQQRLEREVQMNSVVYTELKRQYELARIEEIKSVPVITVLDPGRPAAKKDRPKRAVIVVVSTILAGIVGAGLVIVRSKYPNEWMALSETVGRLTRRNLVTSGS